MGACTGREETNHATNHHRNAPQPLSARLGLSAVRGIRYRHNRRAEASSTGKSTAISAFPFTRITDSAWQAANHAAKAWRFIPLHPSLARSLPLPPLLPRSSSSRSSRVRERERGVEEGLAPRFSIPREPRLLVHAPSISMASEPPRFFVPGTGDLYADRRCRSKFSGDSTGKFVPPPRRERSGSSRRNIDPFPIRHARGIINIRVDLIFFRAVSRNGGRKVRSINTETKEGRG